MLNRLWKRSSTNFCRMLCEEGRGEVMKLKFGPIHVCHNAPFDNGFPLILFLFERVQNNHNTSESDTPHTRTRTHTHTHTHTHTLAHLCREHSREVDFSDHLLVEEWGTFWVLHVKLLEEVPHPGPVLRL